MRPDHLVISILGTLLSQSQRSVVVDPATCLLACFFHYTLVACIENVFSKAFNRGLRHSQKQKRMQLFRKQVGKIRDSAFAPPLCILSLGSDWLSPEGNVRLFLTESLTE